jgi:hypothetical protein
LLSSASFSGGGAATVWASDADPVENTSASDIKSMRSGRRYIVIFLSREGDAKFSRRRIGRSLLQLGTSPADAAQIPAIATPTPAPRLPIDGVVQPVPNWRKV